MLLPLASLWSLPNFRFPPPASTYLLVSTTRGCVALKEMFRASQTLPLVGIKAPVKLLPIVMMDKSRMAVCKTPLIRTATEDMLEDVKASQV